jgi:hypothetical protein
MPAPDPFAGRPERYTVEDWKETLKSVRQSGENSFSRRSAEVALLAIVPSAKLVPALRLFLGYDNMTAAQPYQLRRTNPVRHPRYGLLYCTAASEVEFAPSGKDGTGIPGKVLGKAKRGRVSETPFGDFGRPLGPSEIDLGYWTNYKTAHVLMRFQPLPYPVVEDSVGNVSASNLEYKRNFWIETQARTEVLTLEFQYAYAEGENCPAPHTNPKGQKFKGEVGQVVVKPDVVMHWHLVPESYIMKAGTSLPTKLLAVLGTVNSAEFLGYPRGTLLANGLHLTRYANPLAMGTLPNGQGTEDYYQYDVEVLCSYFKPPKGFTGNPAQSLSTVNPNNEGHNNAPWPGQTVIPIVGVPVDDPNAGKWFFASLTGAVNADGHDCIYRYSEFPTAFAPANNP